MAASAPYPWRNNVGSQGGQRYSTVQGDDGNIVVPGNTAVYGGAVWCHHPYGAPCADPVDIGEHWEKTEGIAGLTLHRRRCDAGVQGRVLGGKSNNKGAIRRLANTEHWDG